MSKILRTVWSICLMLGAANFIMSPSIVAPHASHMMESTGRLTLAPSVVDQQNEDPCGGYDGVLRFRSGDEGAAAATVFFIYAVNHLIYADMYNLLPWAHLDNTSHRIYDSQIHGAGKQHFVRMISGHIKNGKNDVPRGPKPPSAKAKKKRFEITGNGVWESYFEPLSAFSPHRNQSCWTDHKPLYEIDYDGVAGGMHLDADWGVRAWVYGSVPKSDRMQTVRDWYRPMRQRGAALVRRHIRPKPWLQRAAERANPLLQNQTCMAMHVRTTDMELSGGRIKRSLKQYLPHAKAFLKKEGENGIIFLATDSSKTLQDIQAKWPEQVASRVRTQQNAFRSNSSDPVFDLAHHHRTNSEVLIDIYSMAKCSIMIHGRSAVSEAVLYINPDMRETSVDLEDDQVILKDLGYWD